MPRVNTLSDEDNERQRSGQNNGNCGAESSARPAVVICPVDPRGKDAQGLLREAAVEAQALCLDRHEPGAPWPTTPPTPTGGSYLVAFEQTAVEGKT